MTQIRQISVVMAMLVTISGTPAIAAAPSHTAVRLGEQALAFSSGFIRTDVPVDGVVAKTAYNRQILGQSDTLYLRTKQSDQVEVDSLFTVYRRIRKVFHPAGSRYLGNLYAILGVVRVVKTDGEIATAKIERAYGTIYPGDSLMTFELPGMESTERDQALPDTPGMIVDIQHPYTLVAQMHIVYLDWGREQGARPGDRLQVLRRRSGFPVEPIGEVKVLNVEETTAAAVVIWSATPVAIGDLIVPKERSAPVASQLDNNMVTVGPSRKADTSVAAARAQLRQSLASEIAKGDVSVTEVGDKMTISLNDLVDQLEYEPGEAQIKPTGVRILQQISEYLKQQGDQQILVEGHTDNMAIGPTLTKRYPTNKELSEARAKLIVKYFVETG